MGRKSKKDGELHEKKHKKLESKKSPKDDESQEKKHHKELESKKSSNEEADEKITTELKSKESPKEDSACVNLKSKSDETFRSILHETVGQDKSSKKLESPSVAQKSTSKLNNDDTSLL